MCCGYITLVARLILGIIGFLFAVAAYGLLLVGVVGKVQPESVPSLWRPLVSAATSQAATSAAGSSINIPNTDVDIEQLVGGLSTAFIVMGAIFFAIGIAGMASGCCMEKIWTICYLVVSLLLTIGMLIIVIILAVNRSIVTDPAKAELKTTLTSEYKGFNASDPTSLLWNTIMSWQQCCGVDNYKDFDTATSWQQLFGSGTAFGYATPAACCKTGLFDPPTSVVCAVTPTTTNNNMNTGCYSKLLDSLLTGETFIGFGCGTVGCLALLSICSTLILCKILKRNKTYTKDPPKEGKK